MERIVTSMYKVISYFTDLQDFNHPYKVGDIFPRQGLKVSKERLEELSSNKNKQGKPLIREMKDFAVDGEKIGEVKEDVIKVTNEETIKENQFTKTEINRMSTSELKDLAKLNGIDNAEEMKGVELKKVLIEHFNL